MVVFIVLFSSTLTKNNDLQAHKLISLCGWEPRSLPYFVDYKAEEGKSDPASSVSSRHNPHISVYSSKSSEHLEGNDVMMASGAQWDPNSVVLDCGLCGASVGLWAFSTNSRPVEFIRLVGEVDGENRGDRSLVIHTDDGDSGVHNIVDENHFEANTPKNGTLSLHQAPSKLNFTIAGGPPPEKQNFRPTISLPVIGRNLRARFSSDLELEPDGGRSNAVSTGRLMRSESEVREQRETPRDGNDSNMLLEGSYSNGEVVPETNRPECITNSLSQNTANVVESSTELHILPENGAIDVSSGLGVGDLCNSQPENSAILTSGGHQSLANGESRMIDAINMVTVDNCHVKQSSGSEIVCSKQGDGQDSHEDLSRTQPLNINTNRG